MGSRLRLLVLGARPREARAARDAAWCEFEAADRELSRFRADSELSRANQRAGTGLPLQPTRRLRALLMTAARAQRMTGGQFDARVIRFLEEIGERAGVPLPGISGEAAGWLRAAPGRGSFLLGAPVDSGGLGKGLALRWALGAVRRAAPHAAGVLLEAGGDVVVDGVGPSGGAWSIGIEDPNHARRLLATVRVRGGAVATSSVAVRAWSHEGTRVHHLIDPRTGRPAQTGLLAVTVHAADPAWAEVSTKALFLAGRAHLGAEASARGLAAWWVVDDGSLHMTPAARSLTSWTAAEAVPA
jgi:thiamine biosynthesis lipoprotein